MQRQQLTGLSPSHLLIFPVFLFIDAVTRQIMVSQVFFLSIFLLLHFTLFFFPSEKIETHFLLLLLRVSTNIVLHAEWYIDRATSVFRHFTPSSDAEMGSSQQKGSGNIIALLLPSDRPPEQSIFRLIPSFHFLHILINMCGIQAFFTSSVSKEAPPPSALPLHEHPSPLFRAHLQC